MRGWISRLSRSCWWLSTPRRVMASEMTRFCIITDESRHVKMAIVDKNTTPILSVNDPELMLLKPAGLTAPGNDASPTRSSPGGSMIATPITDACALKAVELIGQRLRTAVADGQNIEAREQMAYAQLFAGMAFNNVSALRTCDGAQLAVDPLHGVQRAVLLPHAGLQQAGGRRVSGDIARAMGENVDGLTTMPLPPPGGDP